MDEPTINRESFEPAYLQLVNLLRDRIARGEYRCGDRLPSEAQLCRAYGISPMTVRRAINTLVEQGVVTTTQGRGTFVSPLKLSRVTFALEEFGALFAQRGALRVKIIEASIRKADRTVADRLKTVAGRRTIHIRRLLLDDQEPAVYHQEYLVYDPRRPLVEAEMSVASLEGIFAAGGAGAFKGGTLNVSAAVLSASEAEWLQASSGAPAFHLEHTFYDYNEAPVSWGMFVCRGDKFRFSATVGLWGTPPHHGK